LSFSVVSFPVRFEETTFIVAPDLTSAHLPALWLTRCSLPGIVCEGMRLDGDLILDSSEIDRETVLRGARIGGVLWCVGAKMSNEEGDAITADSAEIDGGVFLRGPFSVVGAVRFPRAKIRGDFDCQGAILTHKNDDALVLDGAEISGPLIVQKAHATGAVRLPSARIGGNVYFHDATLSNEGPSDESVSGFADRAAIYADNAEVNGNFYLGYGLRASGAVQLVGTKIAGDLFCRLVTLSNESGYALSAERAEIDGTLDFYGSSATGEVRLTGAEIGGDLNCSSTRLVNNRYAEVPEIEEFALRAREVAIGGSLIFDDVREVIGGVDLYRSSSAALVDDVGSDDDPLGSWDGVRPLILDGFTYGRFGERAEWSSKL
jgi:hypothetical protein